MFFEKRIEEDNNYVTKYCNNCKKMTKHIKRGFKDKINFREECLNCGETN